EVGSTIRLIMRRLVVLPQPDGPTSTVIPPRGTSSDRPSTATVPSAYLLVTSSNRIMGSDAIGWAGLRLVVHRGSRPPRPQPQPPAVNPSPGGSRTVRPAIPAGGPTITACRAPCRQRGGVSRAGARFLHRPPRVSCTGRGPRANRQRAKGTRDRACA